MEYSYKKDWWETKDHKEIKISDMETSHIENTIKFLKKHHNFYDEEYGCSYTRLEELHDFYFKKYCDLQQENKQLKEKLNCDLQWAFKYEKQVDNWNKLRKWIVYNKYNENTEQHYLVVDYGMLIGKMQELEQGSDSNE